MPHTSYLTSFLSLATWSTLAFFVLILLYIYARKQQNYWKKKGVDQLQPYSIFGTVADLFYKRKSLTELVQLAYDSTTKRFIGLYIFTKPVLLIRDPELIRELGIKNFNNFMDHMLLESDGPLWQKNLFSLKGDDWKEMRSTLSPAFTGVKMRYLFDLLNSSLDGAIEHFSKRSNRFTVELKNFCTRLTTDLICTTSFGGTSNSFKDPDNEFYLNASKMGDICYYKQVLTFCQAFAPSIFKNFKVFSSKPDDFLRKMAKESLKLREENNIVRQDMLQILMKAKNSFLEFENDPKSHSLPNLTESDDVLNRKQKILINDEIIAAQCLIFMFAGNETMGTASSFLLYELAVNTNVQEKLYKEIQEFNNSDITYEDIMNMKYLNMVVMESLRKWPPVTMVERKCTKSFTIQPQDKEEVPLTIEKDRWVWFSVHPIHNDPKYFPNPEKFDPERFQEENAHLLRMDHYLPFGLGPRHCIGYRLAMLCLKLIVFKLLSKFEITITDKTAVPLVLGINHLNLNASGMYVALKPRNT